MSASTKTDDNGRTSTDDQFGATGTQHDAETATTNGNLDLLATPTDSLRLEVIKLRQEADIRQLATNAEVEMLKAKLAAFETLIKKMQRKVKEIDAGIEKNDEQMEDLENRLQTLMKATLQDRDDLEHRVAKHTGDAAYHILFNREEREKLAERLTTLEGTVEAMAAKIQ